MSDLFEVEDAPGATTELDNGLTAIYAPFWGFPNVVYALERHGRLALIDTGVSETPELALDAFVRANGGYDAIDLIVGTHAHLDHIGGNAWFASRSSTARFAVGAKDAGWAEDPDRHYRQLYELGCPGHWRPDAATEEAIRGGIGEGVRVDIPLYGDEDLTLGGDRVLRTTWLGSHTPGQILYVDVETQTAFTGDAIQHRGIMNRDTGVRDFPMFGNLRDYRAAMQRIMDSGFTRLATAHAGVFDRVAGEAFIADALSFAESLRLRVLEIAYDLHEFTLEELVAEYLAREPEYANGLQVRVTLAEFATDLVSEGLLLPRVVNDEKSWSTQVSTSS